MALADNLVAYWSLDEASGDAIDAHSTNDLTDNGSVGATTGKVDGARDFDGSSHFFSLADNTDLSTGDIDFTISCWIFLDALGATPARVVLAKGDNVSAAAALEYGLFGVSGRLNWRVSTGAALALVQTPAASITTGVWYFVVFWHDSVNNQIAISLDGAAATTTSHSNGMQDASGAFRLGYDNTGVRFFDGLIDEVGFWKRVLTSEEITELYNSGNGRDYAYITGGGEEPTFVPFPRPRGLRAGRMALVGGMM